MNRIATTLAIVLVSATAAAAQTGADVAVTRAEPANPFVTPDERVQSNGRAVIATTGNQVEIDAEAIFSTKERAELGLEPNDQVTVTVFEGVDETPSVN